MSDQSQNHQLLAAEQELLHKCLADAIERVSFLKAEMKAATQEEAVWKALNDAVDRGWWCHILSVFEREKTFFHRLREEGHPAIPQLEKLYQHAKRQADDLMFDIPREMEKLAERLEIPLERSQSQHPKYRFRGGFITVEINEKKRLAKLSTYEGKLADVPADIDAVGEVLSREDNRLFNRKFDGAKFLKKLRSTYLAILKKEKRQDGQEVPLRLIAAELAKSDSRFKRDEFLLDLSLLTEHGPAAVDGMRFQLQQTKDTEQGMLLYGPSARGMVNLLVFRKEAP